MNKNVYITTTLPYVNAEPHVGFAMEIIQADVLARYYRLMGREVFFNTGTDEHGQKIHQKAQEAGLETQVYVEKIAQKFKDLKELLNLDFNNFIRTSDSKHKEAAQEFWKRCAQKGDIYKKEYSIKYCVGCESEKTDSELISGRCPLHPNKELELIQEENYFFKYSNYEQKLKDLYAKNKNFVVPEKRFNEIKSFVDGGLRDFSISRLKTKMPWGIPVPGDDEQVMYVWFDALVNYISAIGWPKDMVKFNLFWPVIQLAGKDNLRPQAAMWQAMLMSANLAPSEKIFINGFINVNGQKMSKSLGNVISPKEMVKSFGVDGTRYLLLTMGIFGEDSDISWQKMTTKYNADLANGIGNLASRIIKLYSKVEKNLQTQQIDPKLLIGKNDLMEALRFDLDLEEIMGLVRRLDKSIEESKPWELSKIALEKFSQIMLALTRDLYIIACRLEIYMPQTAQKIKAGIQNKEIAGLFLRKEVE